MANPVPEPAATAGETTSGETTAGPQPPAPAGLERLELRIERLNVTLRFTFAFHAREVRFERDQGAGFERIFPETFSFRADRHDPTELFLQLDDLLHKTELVSPSANRRDARNVVTRLLSSVPHHLERVVERLEAERRLPAEKRLQLHQDTALLAQILLRFLESRDLEGAQKPRLASWVLRRRIVSSLSVVMKERVTPAYLEAYVHGEVDVARPDDDTSESGFFHALEGSDADLADRMILRATEQAFYQWLDGVCLDEQNQAFETEESPFGDREREVMQAITADGSGDLHDGGDLSPFLRRNGRDARRILKRLELWFLRQYDIEHSSAIIRHASLLERGIVGARRRLSWHTTSTYAALLGIFASPFVASIFVYEQAPRAFDLLFSAQVVAVGIGAAWFLVWSFVVRRDLTLFHASVPRIAAGVIVGYLPVFLIDEVWDLASRSALTMFGLSAMLGLVTLLYIFVEVQRRLGDTSIAFARARAIFLLGVLEAFGVGVLMTSLLGGHMVSRNWSPAGEELSLAALRPDVDPLLGELPRIVGVEPLVAFPSVLLLMTFLSFFIGVFLQLMWEDLPITEPL